MPKQTYALEKNGPKRLELSWKMGWKDLTVKFDDREIGVIPDQKALKEGQAFSLPDGSTLHVQLIQKLPAVELQILRDGKPLPGSASDPGQKHKIAYGILFFLGVLNTLLGLAAALFEVELLQNIGIGWGAALMGLIWLVLGFFVMRRSSLALIIALVLYLRDSLATLYFSFEAGGNPTTQLIIRAAFVYGLYQGISAIQELKAAEAPPDALL